jgi:hypothetical protein
MSTLIDPTEWRSAAWIKDNIGIYPARLLRLCLEGHCRTYRDPTRRYPWRYNVPDVRAYLDGEKKPKSVVA